MTTKPRLLLSGVILELTLATALIHLTLGGTLFLLNAVGYLVLGAAYLLAAAVPMPSIRRFSWLPRVGLVAFASVTIVAYLVIGPYFTLGWLTKGVELAIVLLVIADLLIETDAGRAPRRPAASA
jgi:phosphatidylserine synthase